MFKDRLAKFEEWNSQPGQTSKMGITPYIDWTEDEFKVLLGYKEMDTKPDYYPGDFDTENLADAIDWRTKGAVTPIKDQGQCGSCWSFSTTGSMEGAHFNASGTLVSLSESNLVDCSWLNHGCNGGSMALAMMYAESHPLETEADYPYVPKTGVFACKYDKSKGVVSVKSY